MKAIPAVITPLSHRAGGSAARAVRRAVARASAAAPAASGPCGGSAAARRRAGIRGAATAAAPTAAKGGSTRKVDAAPALAGSRLDPSESFLTGANATVLEDMFERYAADPNSVHPSWITFFTNVDAGKPPGEAVAISRVNRNKIGTLAVAMTEGKDLFTVSEDTIKVMALVRAFRHRGHLAADLDPLKIVNEAGSSNAVVSGKITMELDPTYYGFNTLDLDREFVVSGELPGPPVRRLRDVVNIMRSAYCGKVGVEYRHMLAYEEKVWIASHIERDTQPEFTRDEKLQILRHLAEGEIFEKFLHKKHSTAKRFGLEGGEALIPGMQAMMEHGSNLGVENFVLGMPHRGRLNVLANIAQKPLEQIFHEFVPHEDPHADSYLGSGDVKYHLGTSTRRTMSNGRVINFSLLANPSHLEAVDPVVVGKTRAKQFFTNDHDRKRTMAIMLHGDASFAGQGVVAETLELSDLRDYTTGGTIHIVVNNQIGFTTDPRYARSSPYPTDVAKTVGIPIFHVNGDCPESVVRVCKLAMEYRNRYQKDVVIDLFCYRRYGHNELDQPMFTQPHMYKKIKQHPSPLEVYSKRLIEEGVLSDKEYEDMASAIDRHLVGKFESSDEWEPKDRDWLSSHWEGFKTEAQRSQVRDTGVDLVTLRNIGLAHCTAPEGFKIHPLLKRIFGERRQAIELGEGIDWATAEALALGSLLLENTSVRLSGQDSERGTFSQRHAVWHNQDVEAVHIPLNSLGQGPQARLQVCNSNLSEMAVLGFEAGYSLESPNQLVLWEAQFGDFANGAQVIIDTFIAAGERKWRRQSGLVLLLPHGYEGQGPEHSSARLERYLQMCDDDPDVIPEMDPDQTRQIQLGNWQIVNASTPANYFHVLRRQVHRDFRKPLIIMTPKSLLRHSACKSPLADFDKGSRFERLIPDSGTAISDISSVRKLLFCSGKVYYDLHQERAKRQINDVAIARVEQISPFPFDKVAAEVARFPNAEILWVQEESKNMGAWTYVQPRFETALRTLNSDPNRLTLSYCGRGPSAAPATGSQIVHTNEQTQLIGTALS
jgi:2-oxoglutarate dehydrogenase E1 component